MDNQISDRNGGLTAALEACRGELLRFLAARSGDTDHAQDLLQELWLKITSQPAAPIANPRAYLFRMANNLVLDERRARHRAMIRDRSWIEADGVVQGAMEDRPDTAEPADLAMARRQEAEMVQRAVDSLPQGARHALRLYRFEGHSQGEIAQIMGISRSGVEKHLALAMRHLKNAFADCGYFSAAASQGQEPECGRTPHSGKVT